MTPIAFQKNSFIAKILTKIVRRMIEKKTGYAVDLSIEDFALVEEGDNVHIQLCAEAVCPVQVFYDIVNRNI